MLKGVLKLMKLDPTTNKLYSLDDINKMCKLVTEFEKHFKAKRIKNYKITKFDMLIALVTRGMDLNVAYELMKDTNETNGHVDISNGWFKT